VVLGTRFTEQSVRSSRLDDFRVVYFATHGLLPEPLDCLAEPALAVSTGSSTDSKNDGLLVASEIADLKLDADLVVLSACNTGGGTRSGAIKGGGESLSGLARAFFYAGARTLLVTHWPIPDQPTTRLMVGMFTNATREEVSIAEALRQSQAAMIANSATAHPLNWAAFTVVGDGGRRLGPQSDGTQAGVTPTTAR
jgi:CHAT domain-containing protein